MGMSARIKAKKGRFGAGGLAPAVRITSSPQVATRTGSPLAAVFDVVATVTDDENGGNLGNLLAWTSDLDGSVGADGLTSTLTLTTLGTHRVSASVSEGGSPASGLVGSDTFTVVVS